MVVLLQSTPVVRVHGTSPRTPPMALRPSPTDPSPGEGGGCPWVARKGGLLRCGNACMLLHTRNAAAQLGAHTRARGRTSMVSFRASTVEGLASQRRLTLFVIVTVTSMQRSYLLLLHCSPHYAQGVHHWSMSLKGDGIGSTLLCTLGMLHRMPVRQEGGGSLPRLQRPQPARTYKPL